MSTSEITSPNLTWDRLDEEERNRLLDLIVFDLSHEARDRALSVRLMGPDGTGPEAGKFKLDEAEKDRLGRMLASAVLRIGLPETQAQKYAEVLDIIPFSVDEAL